MEIPDIVKCAIQNLKCIFNGTEIKVLSTRLVKNPFGSIGVFLSIEGIKVFLDYEMAEKISLSPYGKIFANNFVVNTIKSQYPELFSQTV